MINVRTLCKRHGARTILADVTATVAKGEIVAIVGPSGGGKSTLLRCLNHLEWFDAGLIDIAGFTLRPGPAGADPATLSRLRPKVGMVFQQWKLFPHLTALANVALAPRVVRGVAPSVAAVDAHALLARVGLGDRGDGGGWSDRQCLWRRRRPYGGGDQRPGRAGADDRDGFERPARQHGRVCPRRAGIAGRSAVNGRLRFRGFA